MRVGRLAHVVHREAGGRDHAAGDCHQQREHPTPAQPFDQQTGDGGAQCRSKGDDHAEHAHRLSAALGRIDAEQHGLQQGHEHAGAASLDDAACEQ